MSQHCQSDAGATVCCQPEYYASPNRVRRGRPKAVFGTLGGRHLGRTCSQRRENSFSNVAPSYRLGSGVGAALPGCSPSRAPSTLRAWPGSRVASDAHARLQLKAPGHARNVPTCKMPTRPPTAPELSGLASGPESRARYVDTADWLLLRRVC